MQPRSPYRGSPALRCNSTRTLIDSTCRNSQPLRPRPSYAMRYRGRPTSSDPGDDRGQEHLPKSLLVKVAQPIPRPQSGAHLRGAHSTAECQGPSPCNYRGARSRPSLSYVEDEETEVQSTEPRQGRERDSEPRAFLSAGCLSPCQNFLSQSRNNRQFLL